MNRYALLPPCLCLAALSLLAAGAHPAGADNPVSATRWEFAPTDADGIAVAAINAPSGDNRIQIYCHGPSKDIVVMLIPRHLSGDAKDQSFTLAYDGGAAAPQAWRAQMYQGRFYDFSLGAEEPGFAAVVDDLQHHAAVEAVITTAGREAQRDAFTLNGAAAAIDQVFAACGKGR